jgi:hypothetical protein
MREAEDRSEDQYDAVARIWVASRSWKKQGN